MGEGFFLLLEGFVFTRGVCFFTRGILLREGCIAAREISCYNKDICSNRLILLYSITLIHVITKGISFLLRAWGIIFSESPLATMLLGINLAPCNRPTGDPNPARPQMLCCDGRQCMFPFLMPRPKTWPTVRRPIG